MLSILSLPFEAVPVVRIHVNYTYIVKPHVGSISTLRLSRWSSEGSYVEVKVRHG